ncbi:MAG TPA: tetratricopeptide repeat protein [Thermoanaerobaculia bacterium]|jgi:Flp pilus assembly protein TadD|nr:tetratricopeptide repeat protein [Thermoanaerobaculia bacterium]
MKRAFTTSTLALAALLALVAGCSSSGSGDLSDANTQRQFGVRMAKMNLWREAMFRFRRATEIEPDNAMAHNNLAVAYEATGDFDAAAKEYREALRLDRGNEHIQKNYSRYVEFMQRGKKRAPAAAATTTAATTPAATSTAAPATPPPPPPVTDTTTTTPPTTTNPPQEGTR